MRELVPIHLLEAFVEICRAGTVSGAAKALHRTQPAVSYRINQLEELTQARLFERTSPRWTLTSRGELLLHEAESILARSRSIHDILHETDDKPRGRVTIGALPTLARHYLVEHLASAIADFPQVQWSVRVGVGNLIEALNAGEIDVLYYIGHLDVQGLEVHELEHISMVYAFAPDLATEADIGAPHNDEKDPLLMLWKGNDPIFTLIENHARAQGLVSTNSPMIPDIDTLKKLAIRGVGYTILPDYVLEDEVASGALETRPIEGLELDLPIREYVVTDRYQGAAQKLFIERVRGALDV